MSIGNCTVEGSKFNDLDGDGARTAGEPYLAGWTIFVDYDNHGILDNNLDTTFVNDMDAIVEAGEEEPYDVTADATGTEPLGAYRITKVQSSSGPSNPAGTWPVREILKSSWDCTAAAGAGAVLAPNVCPEHTRTNPDNALGFRLAWTDNQVFSGRDFGNRRRPAQLKVVKHVNDNGGTALAGAWSLHAKSGASEVTGSPKAGNEERRHLLAHRWPELQRQRDGRPGGLHRDVLRRLQFQRGRDGRGRDGEDLHDHQRRRGAGADGRQARRQRRRRRTSR